MTSVGPPKTIRPIGVDHVGEHLGPPFRQRPSSGANYGGWHALRYSEGRAEATANILQQAREENILACMRLVDPKTGKSYVEKRRVRYDEPGQPRELTFSCYHHYAFLGRDRTREWLCEALDEARSEFGFQLWAYVLMPDHVHILAYPGDAVQRMSRFLQAVKEPVARKAIRYLKSSAPDWLAR